MNAIQILAGPLIGGVIGYFTNFLAIKMLFRPLKEVRIGKFKVPFTPGIIPKGQSRLASAIGYSVTNEVLKEDVIKERLLKEDVKNKIYSSFMGVLTTTKDKDITVKEVSPLIGEAVAKEVIDGISEAVAGSFFAAMLNANTLASFIDPIANRINDMSLGHIAGKLQESEDMLKETVDNKYEELINNKLSSILSAVDFQAIIEDRINDMDVLELEKMILLIMKKELNAVVNLGALLGFIIGIVMIFV
ncbi:MAG: DUF445 family protein [Lachnospiraceae bacterium]|nr:DUF445 family protein [Lachnospiraceae bacterium]